MSTEIMQVPGIGTMLENVGNDVFCTVRADSPKEQAKVFNAINNPTHKLGDVIGRTIWVTDVVAEMAEFEDEDGYVVKTPRIVFIDRDGETYQCTSTGVMSSLKRLMAQFGAPTWEGGLPIIPRQQNTKGANRVYILEVDVDNM